VAHTLRPCRQASTLFTSTLAAHLKIGSEVSDMRFQEKKKMFDFLFSFEKKN
jgi:hypothetical protein